MCSSVSDCRNQKIYLFSGVASAAKAAIGNNVITNIANVTIATTFFFILFIPFFPSQFLLTSSGFLLRQFSFLFLLFFFPSLLFSRVRARLSLYLALPRFLFLCGSSLLSPSPSSFSPFFFHYLTISLRGNQGEKVLTKGLIIFCKYCFFLFYLL